MVRILLFSFLLFISFRSNAQVYTGFKQMMEFDSSRTFDTIPSSRMHSRPVKIDLFYPSSVVKGSPLKYGDFLDMYSLRMDYTIGPDSARKVSSDLAKMFSDYLKLDSGGQYIQFKTSLYPDLPYPNKKYPLIIYAAGMNGSAWENIVLFDSLCKAGYVVAAVSSVGLFPGFMSTAPDIIEQVNDIFYAKNKVMTLPFVDSSRIGLLSWSLGGSAITKVAMEDNSYKCLLSYDGTEIHYYGSDSAWDKQFDELNAMGFSDPSAIKMPYLYLSSDRQKADRMYNIMDYLGSKDKFFVKIDGGTHEHFSSIITVANMIKPQGKEKEIAKTKRIWNLTRTFFDQYLKGSSITSFKELISDKKL